MRNQDDEFDKIGQELMAKQAQPTAPTLDSLPALLQSYSQGQAPDFNALLQMRQGLNAVPERPAEQFNLKNVLSYLGDTLASAAKADRENPGQGLLSALAGGSAGAYEKRNEKHKAKYAGNKEVMNDLLKIAEDQRKYQIDVKKAELGNIKQVRNPLTGELETFRNGMLVGGGSEFSMPINQPVGTTTGGAGGQIAGGQANNLTSGGKGNTITGGQEEDFSDPFWNTPAGKVEKAKRKQAQGEKKFDREENLRKEYLVQSKDWNIIDDGFHKVKAAAANPSPANDMSILFGYMKILDPTSVVRESEYANAENAAGVPEQLRQRWNRALNGEKLTPSMRKDFVQAAEAQYNEQKGVHENVVKAYQGLAKTYGFDPKNVTYERRPEEEPVTRTGEPEKPAYQGLNINEQAQPANIPALQAKVDQWLKNGISKQQIVDTLAKGNIKEDELLNLNFGD